MHEWPWISVETHHVACDPKDDIGDNLSIPPGFVNEFRQYCERELTKALMMPSTVACAMSDVAQATDECQATFGPSIVHKTLNVILEWRRIHLMNIKKICARNEDPSIRARRGEQLKRCRAASRKPNRATRARAIRASVRLIRTIFYAD